MTPLKLSNRLKKIEQAKKDGYWLEALMGTYHLNLEIVYHLLHFHFPERLPESMKTKKLLEAFLTALTESQEMKSIINKRSFKQVQSWFSKSDSYFKTFIHHTLAANKALVLEGEKVAGILNISLNKMHSR